MCIETMFKTRIIEIKGIKIAEKKKIKYKNNFKNKKELSNLNKSDALIKSANKKFFCIYEFFLLFYKSLSFV